MPFTTLKTKYSAFAARHRLLHALALAVLVAVLSLALALWRQNGSTYATGFWDDSSQALVFARMLQVQQNQSAPGGFMGTYTGEMCDSENRYLYRGNAPVAADDYISYTHQSGLQGTGFALINKLLTVAEDSGEARETMLYTINSALFYAATLCICLAVWHGAGALPALGWLLAVLCAPWVQRGMKDLYWCLWTWLLPALAALALCSVTRHRGKTPHWCYTLVGAACMLRCMCGFEFISTFLILCEIPLAFCWAQGNRRNWFKRMARVGFAAVGGVAAALGVWLVQGTVYYGSLAQSAQNIAGAVTTRVSVSDSSVRDVTVMQVLQKYLLDGDAVLQFGGVGITAAQLIAIGAAALAVLALLRSRLALPLACVWVLSLAAPLSWLVLSKAHADIHTHLIPMLWNFALAPATMLAVFALPGQIYNAIHKK